MNQDFVEMLSGLSAARVEFEEAWINHIHVKIQGIEIPVIGKTELIKNKKATGRLQDLADIERLTLGQD